MAKSPEIRFSVSEQERSRLDFEATAHRCSRAELIRKRVFCVDLPNDGRKSIDRAIEAVSRQYHGIPKHQLEPIVCTIICALAAEG